MKIIKYFIIATFAASIAVGCTHSNLDVKTPTFNITVGNSSSTEGDTLVFNAGDTVSFIISGNAENLTFYSGTLGHNYDYRNRTLLDSANPVLSFSSTMQYGAQANTLHIFASKTLPGLDSAHIVNANWTDVTSRAALPTASTTTPLSSGYIKLNDIVTSPSDTLYVAFKYSGTNGSTQRTWSITNYVINNVIAGDSISIAALSTEAGYWTAFGATNGGKIWTSSSTALAITGGDATAPTRDSWIVSRPMIVGSVSPDSSIVVKGLSDAAITNYNYIYNTPGTYKAVWTGFDITTKDEKSVIKTFYIKIE